MNKIIAILLLLTFSYSSKAQEEKPLIDLYETSLQLGLGGAPVGGQLKLNHHWVDTKRYVLMSGVGINSFWGSVNSYTMYNDYLVERSEITGFASDNHLRVYSGVKLFLFKKQRIMFSAEGYLGGYNAFQKGRYKHERLSVDQEYSASQFFLDYGTRIGVGVRIYKSIGVSLNITNSLRKLGYGYRLAPTLYQYAPDNKQILEVSVYWKL